MGSPGHHSSKYGPWGLSKNAIKFPRRTLPRICEILKGMARSNFSRLRPQTPPTTRALDMLLVTLIYLRPSIFTFQNNQVTADNLKRVTFGLESQRN